MRTELTTERLTLRGLHLSDAPRIAALADDWELARWLARVPHPYRLEDAQRWLETQIESWDAGLGYSFAIQTGGDLIGCFGIDKVGEPDRFEIGYWLGRPFWGQGFATEAGRAAIDFCWRDLGLTSLAATHHVDNAASAQVLAKLGFVATGREEIWSLARQAFMPAVAVRLDRDRTAP